MLRCISVSGAGRKCLISPNIRCFGVSGGWGYDSFFGGGRKDHEGNGRLLQLPKNVQLRDELPRKLNFVKWPPEVRTAGSDYFFNSEHKDQFSFFHMNMANSTNNISDLETLRETPLVQIACEDENLPCKDMDSHNKVITLAHSSTIVGEKSVAETVHGKPINVCFVGSVDERRVQPDSNRTLTNCLQKTTRGFAAQVILEGRGVHAYWKPEFPNLFVRLGVGVKPMDCTRALLRFTGGVKVFLNKRGTLITIHGWDKRRTGILAMYLYGMMRANAYTLKGAHIAFEPVRQKVAKKR